MFVEETNEALANQKAGDRLLRDFETATGVLMYVQYNPEELEDGNDTIINLVRNDERVKAITEIYGDPKITFSATCITPTGEFVWLDQLNANFFILNWAKPKPEAVEEIPRVEEVKILLNGKTVLIFEEWNDYNDLNHYSNFASRLKHSSNETLKYEMEGSTAIFRCQTATEVAEVSFAIGAIVYY